MQPEANSVTHSRKGELRSSVYQNGLTFSAPWRNIQLKNTSLSGESRAWISLNKVEWINNKLSKWWNMPVGGGGSWHKWTKVLTGIHTHTHTHTHPRKWWDSSRFELELSILGRAIKFPSESQVWTIKFPVIKAIYDNPPPLPTPLTHLPSLRLFLGDYSGWRPIRFDVSRAGA